MPLETLTDGLSAQLLYLGPYPGEASCIADMHRKSQEMRSRVRGHHHEIYLNSPQRVPEDKLRTIIRRPMEGR